MGYRIGVLATIPIFYGEVYEPPLIEAFVYVNGEVLSPRLTFFVDTAAQKSLIVPGDEALLKSYNPKRDLDSKFIRGAAPVATILGMANFKYLTGNTGIIIPDLNQNPIDIGLDFLYFADEELSRAKRLLLRMFRGCGIWATAGQHAEYSILGRDILERYALYSCLSQRIGFLSDEPKLKAYLGAGTSPIADVISFFQDDDPWV